MAAVISLVQFAAHGFKPRNLFILQKCFKLLDGGNVDKNYLNNNRCYGDAKTSSYGLVYAKQPSRLECEAGKVYYWCACGRSKTQPFCDRTHATEGLNVTQRPLKFVPSKTKIYSFCNCKRSKKAPLCDGTHMTPDVQNAECVVDKKSP